MKKLIFAITCLLLVVQCSGDIITVDDDGPADFNKIQLAIDSAVNGDTIIVMPGVYAEDVNFAGKNIILTSTNPSNQNIVAQTIIGSDYNTLWFQGTENSDCILTGFDVSGIYGNHTCATISNCTLQGNENTCGTVIKRCDGLISNCLIVDNGRMTCACICPTVDLCHGSIRNCTIECSMAGVAISVGQSGVTEIENCILIGGGYPEGFPQIMVESGGTASVSFCYLIQDLQGQQGINWGSGNMIGADPYFIRLGDWDPNNTPEDPFDDFFIPGDYHLLPDSPCIDAGDPNYIPEPNETDLDGNPRIVNGIIDMGAYEAPLSPLDLLIELSESIDAMNLHKGTANSLKAKLNAALRLLEDDNENNDGAAINLLEAFINAVKAQYDKKIPAAEADILIEAAQEIIWLLSGE